MKKLSIIILALVSLLICGVNAKADYPTADVDTIFGEYQAQVDENLYNSMMIVDSSAVDEIYGSSDCKLLKELKLYINPCMAFATTWGEAGRSYPGVSLTTIMDFNPSVYKYEINWIDVSSNLEQIDDLWYIANAYSDYNTNVDGECYHIPNNLLQIPKSGSRATSAMEGLGVGPYQITSSDWENWNLNDRVNPIDGFKNSLCKAGTSWYKYDVEPYSDLTIYALLSLSHQGGSLINYDFGKQLINEINKPEVTKAFNDVGKMMYEDAKELAGNKSICTSDIKIDKYINILYQTIDKNLGMYTGGPGGTNKGRYVTHHCLKYCFYKYYFGVY